MQTPFTELESNIPSKENLQTVSQDLIQHRQDMQPGDSGSSHNFNTGHVSADHKFYSNEYGESRTIDKGGTTQDRYAPVKYAPALNK